MSIPDKYIGMELEILVSLINEVSIYKAKTHSQNMDISFGGWADMNKTTEKTCSETRVNRSFRNREVSSFDYVSRINKNILNRP